MTSREFRKYAHEIVDWMADYLEDVEQFPVRPHVGPGDILGRLPLHPPLGGEPFAAIFADFRNTILPGMTHWQHPSFFAYFPANNSPPSILAEMLTATMGAQCMSWATSPAATELEERMMQWLGEMTGLPPSFTGVIQDTASTATLCAILTARERRSEFRVNEEGLHRGHRFAVYSSTETHSSIERAAKIAGLGAASVRKLPVDDRFAMIPEELERAITRDIAEGFDPLCAVATIGTTGSTAIDPLKRIGEICARHAIWLHVDAAYAGTALLLPELRWMIDGIELADSFVFNPHKWMFTNFDCSAYFVKDAGLLVRTFEILPEYLKTPERDRVHNYRDWGIQLGRRFRALKLWFVIRSFGVEGLRERIRAHLGYAQSFARNVGREPDFEIMAPAPLAAVCFRYHPPGVDDPAALDSMNSALLAELNSSGRMFITHTRLNGRLALRFVASQTTVVQRHIDAAWDLIRTVARSRGPAGPA
ncbi:MAG TPA: aminotransferase class V-fold PLP-dependent enzyme [Bacteroidota bacterium]|nr:aminotransferase class V-fold PLP-dependent enzyme [Bacteroidota bacterium]